MNKGPISVGIVGGSGKMGRWFARFFTAAGCIVQIAGRKTALRPVDLARQSQVVIVTVPIAATVATIREIGPHVASDALLMDFTSLKEEPVKAMLESSRAEVIGTHPLFGPGEKTLRGKNIVLCPARGNVWLPWLQRLFTDHGAHLEIMVPGEHDRAMAIVQGLIHSAHMAMGLAMKESGFASSTLSNIATPNFRKKTAQIRRLFSQEPDLYAQMLFHNPHVLPILRSYADRLSDLIEAVEQRDQKAIDRIFTEVGLYLTETNTER